MGTASKFAPSLNLKEVSAAVSSLNEHQLDVLAYILDGDVELMKIAGTDRAHVETYLAKMYAKLGIRADLPSQEKRRAAALMNRIYDTNGWRPDDADTTFLLYAHGAVAAMPRSAPRLDPEKVVVPFTVKPDVLAGDLAAQASQQPLPSAAHVKEKITGLSEWKLRLLGYVAAGYTKERMLEDLREKDSDADLSTIETNLRRLFKVLGIRHGYEDEGARALVIEAWQLHARTSLERLDADPSASGAKGTDDVQEAEILSHEEFQNEAVSQTPVSETARVDPDLATIVARINLLVSEGKVSERRIKLLDTFLVSKDMKEAASRFGITTSNASVYFVFLRKLFEIPKGTSDKWKVRAVEERLMLIAAWKRYREEEGLTEQVTETVSVQEPAEFPATESAKVSLPEPALQEQVHSEPESAPIIETVAEPESILEPAAEAEAPRASVLATEPEAPAPEPTRILESGQGGLLRLPDTIRGMRMLWSNAPTFEADQAAAFAEGYAMERVEHFVSFHPVFQGVSVLVLAKRS